MDKERRHCQRRDKSKGRCQHRHHNERRAHKDHDQKHRDDLEREDKQSHAPKRDNVARPPLERSKEPALSGNKEYVRRWLAGTADEVLKQTYSDGAQMPAITSRKAKLARLHGQITHSEQHREKTGNPTRKVAKRRHNSSSDSSMLEAPALPIPRVAQANSVIKEKGSSSKSKCKYARAKRNQKSNSVESAPFHISEIVVPPKETFEKRVRHKTREDCYEPKVKRQKVDKTDEKEKGKKSGRKKKEGRKAKKNSEEVMRNFTSKNIGRERITIRAPFGLGLFQNGRSSNCAKKNGVPDLAFSEMLSLQNYERQRPTLEMEQTLAKTREERKKETSRLTKAQEDVSSFFNQFRKPLQELNMNQISEAMSCSSQKPTKVLHHDQTPSLYHQQRDPSLHDVELPDHCLDQLDAGRVSGRETSCITWSETQFSPRPQAKQVNSREVAECCTSPIPKSVLESLRRTGVYIDTGIQTHESTQGSVVGTLRGRLSSHSKLAPETNDIREHNNGKEIQSQHEGTTSTTVSSHHISSSPAKRRNSSEVKVRREHVKRVRERKGKDREVDSSEVTSDAPCNLRRKPGEVIIEHFDRDLGWHQRSSTRSQSGQIFGPPSESLVAECPPKDRTQLAREARIRRPAPILHSQEGAARATDKRDSLGDAHVIRPLIPPLEACVQTESLTGLTSKSSDPSHTGANQQFANDEYPQYITQPRIPQVQDSILKHQDYQEFPLSLETVPRNTTKFSHPVKDFRASSSLYHHQQPGLRSEMNRSSILDLPIRGGLSNRINIATSMSALPVSEPLFVKQIHQDVEVGNSYRGSQNITMTDPRMDIMSPEPNFRGHLDDWNYPLEFFNATQHSQHLETSDDQLHEYVMDANEIHIDEPTNDPLNIENHVMDFSRQFEIYEERDNFHQYDTNQYDGYQKEINGSIKPRGKMFY